MATKNHPYRKPVIWLVVLICLVEAFTKGWMALLMLPASLVILPAYVIVQYAALRHADGPRGKRITLAATTLTVSLLLSYICTVGSDDTDQALLFGFYSAQDSSFIARLSDVVSIVAYCVAVLAFFVLIAFIAADRRKKR